MSTILIDNNHKIKSYKTEYATLHSTAYGMFNSDVWTVKIIRIIDHKIKTFDLNTQNKNEVKSYIQTIIDTLIVEAQRIVKERTQGKHGFFESILGSTKQMITNSIIDFEDLRKRVPEFTDKVMIEIGKPQNQAQAKKVLQESVQKFISKKFKPTTDMTLYNRVIHKYGDTSFTQASTLLDTKIEKLSSNMNHTMKIILGLSFLLILFIVLQGTLNTLSLFLLSGTTLSLLSTGIMLPMLDIEAKIAKLYFVIMDQPIVFENQILFFQTKSISDLLQLLINSGEAKMILVGILLTVFSILFPMLKLISTAMYFYGNTILTNNPITRFFALKSTKWSMADVMVVSIFMAYLGLDGVVNSELKQLENKGNNAMNIITTNHTHLEIGFFLFLGFVLSSFILSMLVEKYKKL